MFTDDINVVMYIVVLTLIFTLPKMAISPSHSLILMYNSILKSKQTCQAHVIQLPPIYFESRLAEENKLAGMH